MESLSDLKNIIDSAPEGATHIDDYGDYIRYELGKKSVEYHCSIRGWWEVDWCDVWVMRPLSDIKRIIELMEAVNSLPDKLDTNRWLEGLDKPTEFAISQAKSFAIGSVFDSIRNAKKLL